MGGAGSSEDGVGSSRGLLIGWMRANSDRGFSMGGLMIGGIAEIVAEGFIDMDLRGRLGSGGRPDPRGAEGVFDFVDDNNSFPL